MYTKFIKWFAQTRLGGWLFLNVFNRIDKPLMKLTNARLSTGIGTAMSKNAILLNCTGAKSGVERDVPLLCTPSGDDLVLVASRTGHINNPAWYYNLKAHPDCVVRFRGKKFASVAKEAKGAQREELWKLATEQYPGYDTYATRTARVIPVMLLAAAGG
jgi:deazaflavin-dependent oxidoreductase (nitroreductase family)